MPSETEPFAKPSRSSPGIARTFSSWSRTQGRRPRLAGADLTTSTRTAQLAGETLLKACAACQAKVGAILCSRGIQLEVMLERDACELTLLLKVPGSSNAEDLMSGDPNGHARIIPRSQALRTSNVQLLSVSSHSQA